MHFKLVEEMGENNNKCRRKAEVTGWKLEGIRNRRKEQRKGEREEKAMEE